MYAQLASKMAISDTTDPNFSPAFSMSGANTAKAGITVFANSATSLTVTIQGSNDLQNWTDSTSDTGFVVGYAASANRALAFAYGRLKYDVVGTGTIVFAADVNTSQQ